MARPAVTTPPDVRAEERYDWLRELPNHKKDLDGEKQKQQQHQHHSAVLTWTVDVHVNGFVVAL